MNNQELINKYQKRTTKINNQKLKMEQDKEIEKLQKQIDQLYENDGKIMKQKEDQLAKDWEKISEWFNIESTKAGAIGNEIHRNKRIDRINEQYEKRTEELGKRGEKLDEEKNKIRRKNESK